MPQLSYKFINNGSSRTIVYLHGFLGRGDDWDNVIQLADSAVNHLKIDLPGHGKSGIEAGTSFDNTASQMIAILDRLDIGRALLCAYSMGGRLGLYLTLKYPSRFSKVLLESASPGLEKARERAARKTADEKVAGKLATQSMASFLKYWYNQPLFESLRLSQQYEAILENRLKNHPEYLASALLALGTGTQPSLWNKLINLDVPLLLIIGEKDIKFRNIAERMININQQIQLKIMPGCGHNTHDEDTNGFVDIMKSYFLSDNSTED